MTNELEKNPWKTLSSKEIYKNPWIRLREDQVIRPDGENGIYSVVDTRIATGILALTEDKELYLVGQYRYPTDMYSWEIIEGGTDPEEAPLETAKRELKEEAGLIAESWTQIGGEIHLSNCFTSEVGYIYLARNLSQTQSSPDGNEVLQVKKLPFSKCLEMVQNGEIYDAMSIIGIMQLQQIIGDL